MSPVPLPAPDGHDGEQPPQPADPARDGAAPESAAPNGTADGAPLTGAAPGGAAPGGAAADDYDVDADLARLLEDVDAGRVQVPSEEELQGPEVMFAFGESADVDPAVLAVMAGPDGLGGQAFSRQAAGDALRPGPLLAALAENAAADLAGLDDDALLGLISAARRLASRAEFLELAGTAEFTARRQAQHAASAARKVPRGRRAGEFAADELAMELLVPAREAGNRMDLAAGLAVRLPATFAGLGAGTVTADKAYSVWFYTRFLSGADAAHADAVLAAAAPGIRAGSLAAKAARLEMRLDPAAARARKEHARGDRRVEARREPSGNMSYGARELAVEEALAVNAAVEADAAALRRAGMPGTLSELRVLCFLDRLRGVSPFDRLAGPGGPAGPAAPADPGTPADPPASGTPAGPGGSGSDPAPFPAMINLLVHVGTLFGWSTAPGEAGRWGLLDPDDTRRLVQAASAHPRTRWCVTVTGPDGTAAAHGCSRGPHRWTPAPPATTGPGATRPPPGAAGPGTTRPPPGPDEYQQAQLTELLRALNVTLAPIAKGTCDHKHRENQYRPSRKLGHLVR